MLLILPLGFVIVFMARLRDPQTADRINNVFTPADVKQPGPDSEKAVAPNRIQTKPGNEPAKSGEREPFLGVRPELLRAVQDNTYFRKAETVAWFHLLEILQRTPSKQIESSHSIEADYVQLVDQPNFYRGKLVTVYGYVREVTKQTPAANDLGIKSYYRIVVQPTDGAYWPIFVYCLELPPDLPLDDGQMANMKVTGLFFKNLSYRWRDGLGTAPVILAKSIEYFGAVAGLPRRTDIHEPVAADAWAAVDTNAAAKDQPAEKPPATSTSFREILVLAGWDAARLAQFDDGTDFAEDQRGQALQLLRRLRSFDSTSLADWAHDGLAPYYVLKKPDEYRGQLVHLTGRITKVTKHQLNAADAQRLEMPEYFECAMVLDKEGPASTVLTTRVPKAWLRANKLDEPASATALYLRRLANGDPPSAIWLAKEIAWHPGKLTEPDAELFGPSAEEIFGEKADPLLGLSVLGFGGMDVGLLDQIQKRGRIRPEERETFYQMLGAVNHLGAHELIQFADRALPAWRAAWEQKLKNASSASRRKLASEVVRAADAGRYSVAPLFNEPQNHIGQLFVFDGVARRVVRVEIGKGPDGREVSDVARRFGIDHYYEIEVFTGDSQNYPVIFCVRDLPDGFPIGANLHESVRVAGFFFKDWLYRTRQMGGNDDAGRAQYAPLLIGRAPVILQIEKGRGATARLVGGGLFVLILAGIWFAAAWYARSDRVFRKRTIVTTYSLPPGQSLNDLNVPAVDEPMRIIGPREFPQSDSS